MSNTELEAKAIIVREEIIKMLVGAGSGHPAGALGATDFFVWLYFGGELSHDPRDPWNENRDRVVLSAGHYCPVLYAVLAESGYFSKEDLSSLRQINSKFQGHPVARLLPGIETSSGPLGQGVSVAVGMALADKMDGKNRRTICFMGDGEQDEGQVWEAYLSANKFGLKNLLFVVDRNNIQIDGLTQDVMPLEPFDKKLEAFGLHVLEVNGHNFDEIAEAFAKAKTVHDKASVIILRTIPGKGVDFMENNYNWHGRAPGIGETVQALMEIRKVRSLDGRVSND